MNWCFHSFHMESLALCVKHKLLKESVGPQWHKAKFTKSRADSSAYSNCLVVFASVRPHCIQPSAVSCGRWRLPAGWAFQTVPQCGWHWLHHWSQRHGRTHFHCFRCSFNQLRPVGNPCVSLRHLIIVWSTDSSAPDLHGATCFIRPHFQTLSSWLQRGCEEAPGFLHQREGHSWFGQRVLHVHLKLGIRSQLGDHQENHCGDWNRLHLPSSFSSCPLPSCSQRQVRIRSCYRCCCWFVYKRLCSTPCFRWWVTDRIRHFVQQFNSISLII